MKKRARSTTRLLLNTLQKIYCCLSPSERTALLGFIKSRSLELEHLKYGRLQPIGGPAIQSASEGYMMHPNMDDGAEPLITSIHQGTLPSKSLAEGMCLPV